MKDSEGTKKFVIEFDVDQLHTIKGETGNLGLFDTVSSLCSDISSYLYYHDFDENPPIGGVNFILTDKLGIEHNNKYNTGARTGMVKNLKK